MKKAFYASAFIFETLKVFGEVSDEVGHAVVMEIISVWLGAVGYYGDNWSVLNNIMCSLILYVVWEILFGTIFLGGKCILKKLYNITI